jgi:phosphosulfolactate synthase
MGDYAFNMCKLRSVPPRKPRKDGFFVGTEQGMSLGAQEDILRCHSDIIDYVKFGDVGSLYSRYSADWLKKKAALYRRYDVRYFIGGIGFEVAVLQGKVDQYFEKCKEVGFTTVEIAEDAIPPMPPKDRTATVRKALNAGLEVFTEIGVKYPDKPLDVNEAIDTIKADLDAGAATVTIEVKDMVPWGTTLVTKDTDTSWAEKVVGAVGLDKLVFECYPPHPWTAGALWLLHHFGQGCNLAHIDVEDCILTYQMRVGMTRGQEFPGMYLD